MPIKKMVHTPQFIVYDGTNGVAVVAYMNSTIGGGGRSLISDNGTVLKVNDSGFLWDFHIGDGWSNEYTGFWPADQMGQLVTKDSMTPVAPNPTGTSDIVSIAVPLLLLGATVDRPVVWNRPFPDTTYKVSYALDVNTLGKITPVVKSGTKTAAGLTVTVSAALALTVAGVIHVLGTT